MHRVLEVSMGILAKNANKKKVRVLDLQSIALLDSSVGDDFLGKVIQTDFSFIIGFHAETLMQISTLVAYFEHLETFVKVFHSHFTPSDT